MYFLIFILKDETDAHGGWKLEPSFCSRVSGGACAREGAASMTLVVTAVAPILGITARLVELLRPYASYVLPAIFFGFFLAAVVAVAFYRTRYVRRTFVASVFVALILFNFIVPTAPPPFVSWGHFSEPTSEVETYHEIRFVDGSGNEIKIDDRLTLEFDAVSMVALNRRMRNHYSEQHNEEVARQMLLEAREYREDICSRTLRDWVRYPHHGLTSVWTPELLEEYGPFVGIRMYEMTFHTTADGTEVVQYEEEVAIEVFPFDERPTGPPQPSAMPTRSMNRTVLRDSDSVARGGGCG